MNYDRKVHKKTDLWKNAISKMNKVPIGEHPVIYNDTMRFGKYKGKRYGEIPTGYLEWLVSITTDDTLALKYCKELATRPKYEPKTKLQELLSKCNKG